jgi:hypothetical protein
VFVGQGDRGHLVAINRMTSKYDQAPHGRLSSGQGTSRGRRLPSGAGVSSFSGPSSLPGVSSGRPTSLARRGFSESEDQGWCSDEPELLDPRPIEPAVQVVGQEQAWGFHRPAELMNGRLAMLGFVLAVATEWLTGQGALGQLRALIP